MNVEQEATERTERGLALCFLRFLLFRFVRNGLITYLPPLYTLT
jgi:hypothetical protein